MFVSNVHYGVVVVADTVVDAMTSTVVDALAVVVACPELVCGELACGEPVESVEAVEAAASGVAEGVGVGAGAGAVVAAR